MISPAAERLAGAGVDSPRLDAELLLAEVCDSDRARVVAGLVEPSDKQLAEFDRLLARRESREPLAQILGRKGFRNIELAVDRRVLTPRPETELLVAVAKVGRPCGILDVATGSGAVALALADELPDATITACDVSEDALAVARSNARRLGADVTFIRSDLLDQIEGRFDAITANLPYVTTDELAQLQPEIKQFEPAIALDGGEDGLDLIRRLAEQAVSRLKPGGLLALEIGCDQGSAVSTILDRSGFCEVEVHRDLAGHDRVVSGRATR